MFTLDVLNESSVYLIQVIIYARPGLHQKGLALIICLDGHTNWRNVVDGALLKSHPIVSSPFRLIDTFIISPPRFQSLSQSTRAAL